jgi:hypothetical protein
VGTSLARVVDPVYNPGKSSGSPALTPSGTFSFRLLPKRARKGAGPGEAPGETTVPERVTVNFDAIPEQYRTVVRTYFDLLARSSAERAADTLNP